MLPTSHPWLAGPPAPGPDAQLYAAQTLPQYKTFYRPQSARSLGDTGRPEPLVPCAPAWLPVPATGLRRELRRLQSRPQSRLATMIEALLPPTPSLIALVVTHGMLMNMIGDLQGACHAVARIEAGSPVGARHPRGPHQGEEAVAQATIIPDANQMRSEWSMASTSPWSISIGPAPRSSAGSHIRAVRSVPLLFACVAWRRRDSSPAWPPAGQQGSLPQPSLPSGCAGPPGAGDTRPPPGGTTMPPAWPRQPEPRRPDGGDSM